MSKSTDRLLKCTVLKNPMMTVKEIKKAMFLKLGNISVHNIQHHLQKDLKLSSRSASMKPLITDKMRKNRVAFAKNFKHWIPERWGEGDVLRCCPKEGVEAYQLLPVQLPLHGPDNEAP
jgi:hypothetical protein